MTGPEPTEAEVNLVKCAAVTTRLYVTAALTQAEEEAVLAVRQVFAKVRAAWVADLTADPPLKLLVLAEQELMRQRGEG